MSLVADRFLVRERKATIDLATGESVVLKISIAGGPSEQARWAARCARFAALRHQALAPLVDYGLIGEVRRFEAWSADGPWQGAAKEGAHAASLAQSFLRLSALTPLETTPECLHVRQGRPVVVPDSCAGHESPEPVDVDGEPSSLDLLGVSVEPSPAALAVVDALADTSVRVPRAFALWARERADLQSSIHVIARHARLHGYVPLALRCLDVARGGIAGRSVCLLGDDDGAEGWRALLALCLVSARPHVLVFAGPGTVHNVPALPIPRMTTKALIASVRPVVLAKPFSSFVQSAARCADGSPGRMAARLWRVEDGQGRAGAAWRAQVARPDGTRVADAAGAHDVEAGAAAGAPAIVSTDVDEPVWPAPGELSALRRRMQRAVVDIDNGRRASGDRALRQAIGGLARRCDWPHAVLGTMALGRALIKRGQARQARELLADATSQAVRLQRHDMLAQLAVMSGVAALEDLQLDEAEALLRTAHAAAEGLREPEIVRTAALALARCLFWRGRFDQAGSILDASEPAADSRDAVRRDVARSRLAAACGDLSEAVTRAASAVSVAADCAPELTANAGYAAACAHLAVADYLAVDADVARVVHCARTARDPLLGLRAHLLRAEADRRRGRESVAQRLVTRVRRMQGIPALLRARVELLGDLLKEQDDAGVLTKHIKGTGLGGLRVFVPAASTVASSSLRGMVRLLECCQSADEDHEVLTRVCARLRDMLDAVSAAFVSPQCAGGVLLASSGGRMPAEIAPRVEALAGTILPHEIRGSVEGGAPVRYAGRLIGVLAARWPLGVRPRAEECGALLEAAATAAAPSLAALLARRAAAATPIAVELLGNSQAIEAVRRGIMRAASAPFAVLIEGESGCGKELVARGLQRQGARRDRPYCTLNCAALPDDLVESELFGHARGAFTGAVAERMGVFEAAHTGTVFLDEIGELSPRAQAKVLRTVQEGEIRRVGDNTTRRIDVRLIAATNRDLRREAAEGRFRTDLLYRLDVIRITIPPLRERRDDLPVLTDHFWREAAQRVGSRATLSTATIASLARYDWPGNVRELQNVLAALAVRCPRRGVVGPSALPPAFGEGTPAAGWRLDEARRTFDTQFVRAALTRSGGHRARAAEELGVTRQGLTKLIARLGIPMGDESLAKSD